MRGQRRDMPSRADLSGRLAGQDPTTTLSEYEIRHLAEHLESLGDLYSLDKILRLEWAEQDAAESPHPGEQVRFHPAWFEAKNRSNLAADFIEDVHRAWRLAATPVANVDCGESAAGLALEVRYALVLASLNSYAAAVPLSLAVELARGGIWTTAQAVAYARRIAKPGERRQALSALLPILPDPLRSQIAAEAYSAAMQARADDTYARLLVPDNVAACLAEGLVRQALERAPEDLTGLLLRLAELGYTDDAMRWAAGHWQGQVAIAAYLSEDQVRRWLAEPPDDDTDSLHAALYVRLAALGHADEALREAQRLEYPGPRTDFCVGVARFLPAPLMIEARALASRLLQPDGMVRFLAALADAAPDEDRTRYLDDALVLLSEIDNISAAVLLNDLIPYLGERQLDEAAAIARNAGNSYPALNALSAIAQASAEPHPDELRRDLLSQLSSVNQGAERWRTHRLERQVAVAHAGLMQAEGLRRVGACSEELERAWGLMDLAGMLPDSLLVAAVDVACDIQDDDYRIPALGALAPRLSGSLLDRALGACSGVFERHWSQALRFFTPYLPQEKLREAVTRARRLEDPVWRAWAYYYAADYLQLPDLRELESLTLDLGADAAYQANEVLAQLAIRFAACGEHGHALDLLGDIRPSRMPSPKVDALLGMAASLPPELLSAAFDALGDEWSYPSLAQAARRLDAARRIAWLESAKRRIAEGNRDYQARELAGLTACFGEPAAASVIEVAENANTGSVLEAIGLLAPALSPGLVGRALDIARSAPVLYAAERSRALLAIADCEREQASESLLADAMRSAFEATPHRYPNLYIGDKAADLWQAIRIRLYALASDRRHLLLHRALLDLSERGRDDCLAVVGELVPLIGRSGGTAALDEILAATGDVSRWWP